MARTICIKIACRKDVLEDPLMKIKQNKQTTEDQWNKQQTKPKQTKEKQRKNKEEFKHCFNQKLLLKSEKSSSPCRC